MMQQVYFEDLGLVDYKTAWDYQERLLHANVAAKSATYSPSEALSTGLVIAGSTDKSDEPMPATRHSLLFVEHPPVYTLGKSGKIENILLTEAERLAKGIDFYYSNRGGDITFHGPEQLVGYPILDLEKFYTDIGLYLRSLEEVIIRTMADYGLHGERSAGETGVWLNPGIKGKERKICAIGVRCSRWVTMHGFAFNINTDLAYFDHIIPCGIQNKQVTSLSRELARTVSVLEAKQKVKQHFENVFGVELVS
ncbi:MAG: lipoyl(octanoyl) transferase LipB [Bacteroidota bacterium]